MRRRALERLVEHQQAITTILDQGDALLNARGRDTAAIARTRWTLTRALTAYQLFKHREIFDPVISGRVGSDAVRAARMKAACTMLGDDFRLHVQKWSGSDVAGEWATYRPAALAIIARIRSHIARERAEAAALLGGG